MSWIVVLALLLPAYAADGAADSGQTSEPAATQLAAAATATADDTFGHLLDDLRQTVTWSAYGDFALDLPPGGPLTFDASHFNPILGARLAKHLWTELELELEHAGSVVKMEYGFLDWRPSSAFTLRMGRILVPIGAFNDRLHPSFRWPQVSRPAMAADVIPSVWSDVGIQAFGDVNMGPSLTGTWTLYAINGLGGTWDPTQDPAIADLRDNVLDNNSDKGLGGRIGATMLAGGSRVRLDLSGYTGLLDDAGTTRLFISDVSLDAELGRVVLRSELAGTTLGAQPWRAGAYVQAGILAGRYEPALRYDMTRGLQDDTMLDHGVASFKVTISPLWNVRAEVDVDLRDPAAAAPGVGAMSAFFF